MTNRKYSYIGSELELFRDANNWKNYLQKLLKNYLFGEILEVGAGIGGTTRVLCDGSQKRWVCLEPDPKIESTLHSLINNGVLPSCCESKVGTMLHLGAQENYDTIIYIDVLEHIKNDKNELYLAATHLREGGYLVVLAPAHQWLYTPFDEAIGHYRRYNQRLLSKLTPESLKCINIKYVDSFGLLASIINRLFLHKKMPGRRQLMVWDNFMVPLSKNIDILLKYRLGKSILVVWKKV